MSWFKKLIPAKVRTNPLSKRGVPEGVWTKCPQCEAILYRAELERALYVCPKCEHHLRLTARMRLKALLDENSRQEIAIDVKAHDFLKFKDSKKYKDRLSQAQKATGEEEALIAFQGHIATMPVVAVAFEMGFMGGSMGSAVGERFVRSVQVCLRDQVPLICFSASGGARMQEGLISLMQMAKTSAALARLRQQVIPFISVLTDPTMGGVSASFANLGDVIIAEPNALIGFTGPRVIEQTVRQTLPEGFQRSEFLLEHGAIDMIVDRRQLRQTLLSILTKLTHRSAVNEATLY